MNDPMMFTSCVKCLLDRIFWINCVIQKQSISTFKYARNVNRWSGNVHTPDAVCQLVFQIFHPFSTQTFTVFLISNVNVSYLLFLDIQ